MSHRLLRCSITVFFMILVVFSGVMLSGSAWARTSSGRFDVSYIWHGDLDSLLEYKGEVEKVLGKRAAAKIRVVKQGKLYGLVYDRDGDSVSSARVAENHSRLLIAAGLEKAELVKDKGYHELYNVSYGMGRNLEALKKQYSKIYKYLGREVGKKLFIEQTGSGNYMLIYRRRGDRRSTATVARRHAKILKRKRISASITREDNNEIVFGESSLLDRNQPLVVKKTTKPKIDIKAMAEPRISQASFVPSLASLAPRKIRAPEIKPVALKKVATDLEIVLEEYIKKLRNRGVIARDESTAWLVYDLTSGRNIVDINKDIPFQAASMIKPLVALAFFHKVKEGKLIYGPKSRRRMERMIQRSSNSSTNWVMRHVGGPAAVQRILKQYYGHLFKQTRIVEYIPAGGQTYRNMASPEDYGMFLAALWRGEVPYSKELRRLMALPGHDRLYHGTVVPQGTLVYNKTGSTAHLCGDMGILAPRGADGRRYPYAIIGIIEKKSRARNYGHWMMARGNVIRQVSNMVYEEMKGRYQLR